MRTFSQRDWEAALQAWDEGQFSDEWKPWRHLAVMGGLIYPPEGTRFDSWEDARPSQRAMIVRAIREQPTLLRQSLLGAPTWSKVVERLIRARDDWREELTERENELLRFQREERALDRSAPMALKAIMQRIGDS